MKMTKKLLLAAAVMLAASFGFIACSDSDDEEGAISGSKLEYDNTGNSTSIYRAYKSTKLKHLGTLAQIEIKDQDKDIDDYPLTTYGANGVLGLIWDLKSSENAQNKYADDTGYDFGDTVAEDGETVTSGGKPRNFLIAGFRYNRKLKNVEYYISKFYRVTDVNGDNFGAGTTNVVTSDSEGLQKTKGTWEQVIVKGTNSAFKTLDKKTVTPDSDGSVFIWVDIYPALTANGKLGIGAKITDDYTKGFGLNPANPASVDGVTVGAFVVDVYLTEPQAGSTPDDRVVITTDQTGYTTSTEVIPQAKIARYLNAYQKSAISGVIKYKKTYAEAEVIEDEAE